MVQGFRFGVNRSRYSSFVVHIRAARCAALPDRLDTIRDGLDTDARRVRQRRPRGRPEDPLPSEPGRAQAWRSEQAGQQDGS